MGRKSSVPGHSNCNRIPILSILNQFMASSSFKQGALLQIKDKIGAKDIGINRTDVKKQNAVIALARKHEISSKCQQNETENLDRCNDRTL